MAGWEKISFQQRGDHRMWDVFWRSRQIILQKRYWNVRKTLDWLDHSSRELCWSTKTIFGKKCFFLHLPRDLLTVVYIFKFKMFHQEASVETIKPWCNVPQVSSKFISWRKFSFNVMEITLSEQSVGERKSMEWMMNTFTEKYWQLRVVYEWNVVTWRILVFALEFR